MMKICNFEFPDNGLVLIAGRPGIGKSCVILEMANELNQKGIKPVLLYADGWKSHSSCHYEDGVVREYPSKLSCVKKIYPDIPYIVEDYAIHYSAAGWESLVKSIIKFEQPKVLFINHLTNPEQMIDSDVLEILQNVAKENGILIVAESNVSRAVEERTDHHPQAEDVNCDRKALGFVDQCVCVYRDVYYTQNEGEKHSKIEVYTAGQTIFISFNSQMYRI